MTATRCEPDVFDTAETVVSPNRPLRAILVGTASVALLAGLMLVGICYGATTVTLAELWQSVVDQEAPARQIIVDIRAPRVVLAALCGAALGAAGLASQALLRNPLADPYILGMSSGAAAGASCVLVLGMSVTLPFLPDMTHTVGAFFGSCAALGVVMMLSADKMRTSPERIIFAGMAVNYFFSAMTSLIVLWAASPAVTRSVMFWMLGSLSSSTWRTCGIVGTALVVCGVVLLVLGRRLDLLGLGDDSARSTGTDPQLYRWILLLTVAVLVSAVVSFTGAIGFVGLIIPHVAKRFKGAIVRHSMLLAMVLGAGLLVCCDLVSRTLAAPAEISVGVITSLIGAPAVLIILQKLRK